MTQADGVTPTAQEIRAMLGRAKHDTAAYVATLTSAAVGLGRSPGVCKEQELLTALTEAHHNLTIHLEATFTSLGLPYERVIEAEFTEEPYVE